MIREGRDSHEIAETSGLSLGTVAAFRAHNTMGRYDGTRPSGVASELTRHRGTSVHYTSQLLSPGTTYTREQLSSMFEITDATINTGIFLPAGTASIWLFVTRTKTPDRRQYVDSLEGDTLHWQGQMAGRKDALIREHEQRGLELLVFYREEKYQFLGAAFRYEGPFRHLTHSGARPTTFTLRRLHRSTNMPDSVEGFPQAETLGSGNPDTMKSYFPEFSGTALISPAEAIVEVTWEHGKVIDALAQLLMGRGFRPGKSRTVDLCLSDSENQVTTIFEAKTDADPYSIYTAIGQLEYHSIPYPGARRVVVLPGLTPAQRSGLSQLGIEVVTYARMGDQFTFEGLVLPDSAGD
jgi:hypothetical protein